MSEVVFITGTGTGVGKTLLTAMLLHYLREEGCRALAMKPFCSGGRGDARMLLSLQKDSIDLNSVNPFYFPKPQAPWVAKTGKIVTKPLMTMQRILKPLIAVKKRCDTLLVEGSGGIFVPLSATILVADMIVEIADRVIVVAPNALGTINHTLLTVCALQSKGIKSVSVVLMAQEHPDISACRNQETLAHFLGKTPVLELPFLGKRASSARSVRKTANTLKPLLAKVFFPASLP